MDPRSSFQLWGDIDEVKFKCKLVLGEGVYNPKARTHMKILEMNGGVGETLTLEGEIPMQEGVGSCRILADGDPQSIPFKKMVDEGPPDDHDQLSPSRMVHAIYGVPASPDPEPEDDGAPDDHDLKPWKSDPRKERIVASLYGVPVPPKKPGIK